MLRCFDKLSDKPSGKLSDKLGDKLSVIFKDSWICHPELVEG
jgi:hypothetical protein